MTIAVTSLVPVIIGEKFYVLKKDDLESIFFSNEFVKNTVLIGYEEWNLRYFCYQLSVLSIVVNIPDFTIDYG